MFIQLTLLHFFLLQFLCISASRYGTYCTSDSDCDQHQKCLEGTCRCNIGERRFWTGEICAVCVVEFSVTYDRCFKIFNEVKTWTDARAYCRTRYADLFTWRNNIDEQFIRTVIRNSIIFIPVSQLENQDPNQPRIAWTGATITSLNPHTTKWVDPDGIKLDLYSDEWCDPTTHAGYVLGKEPSSGSRKTLNHTEREQCVTYNFDSLTASLLCLADDYCSQRYPFICEMNAASMKLANSVLHGTDDDDINFEEAPPPPPPPPSSIDSGTGELPPDIGINPGNTNSPSAIAKNKNTLSMTNIVIFLIIGIILVIGAIVGYKFIKKKKEDTDDHISNNEEAEAEAEASQGGPSFTSTIGSLMDE